MLLDYRKLLLDVAEIAGKNVNIKDIELINDEINAKVKQGYSKTDVFEYYANELKK